METETVKTDGALLAEFARTRSETAFAEIVRRHGPMVFAVCRRVTGREDLAEEAANATFLVLARKAAAVSGRPDTGGWLHRVADKSARAAVRDERRRAFHERRAAAMKTGGGEQDAAGREEILQNVDAALGKLREGERAVVVGLYLEGRPRKDVAVALGLPEGTVASRSASALEKLRRLLGRHGLLVSAAGLGALLAETAEASSVPASFASLPALASGFAATKAAGTAGAGLLAQGVLKTMFWTKLSVAASLVVAVTGIGMVTPEAYRAVAGETAEQKKEAPVIAGETAEPKKEAPGVAEPAAEEAVAVNGLKLVLVRSGELPVEWKHGPRGWKDGPYVGIFCPQCNYSEKKFAAGAMPKCANCQKNTMFKYCGTCSLALHRCIECGVAMPLNEGGGYQLRWENTGKEPLVLSRDRCCDLYDHVFLKGPDGKLAPARRDNRARFRHGPAETIGLEPAKTDEQPLSPWQWVIKPEAPGEYTLWVEFEQGVPPKPMGKNHWQGKVRSNAVKVVLEGASKSAAEIDWGNVVNGLQAGIVPLGDKAASDWPGPFECPKCVLNLRRNVPGKCKVCGGPTRTNLHKMLCGSCAAERRVCDLCGAAKPWSAVFVEGEPIRLEAHFRNTGHSDLQLYDAGYPSTWSFAFTLVGGNAPFLAIYDAMDKRAFMPVAVPKGKASTCALELGILYKFKDPAGTKSQSSLPPGKYTLTASYEHAEHPRELASCPFWHGKAATGAVGIEIKAKGAGAGLSAERAKELALEAAKKTFGGKIVKYPDGTDVEPAIGVDPYRPNAAELLRAFWPEALFFMATSTTPEEKQGRPGWGGTVYPGVMVVTATGVETLVFKAGDPMRFAGRGIAFPDSAEKAEAAGRTVWALLSGEVAEKKSALAREGGGWRVDIPTESTPATFWITPPAAGGKGCGIRWQRLSPPPPPPPGKRF